jgi:hypothetical protein
MRSMEKGMEAWRYSKGVQAKLETQSKSTSSPPRSPGAVCLKLDAQATYGVGFGCSIYGWNHNCIRLPMSPVTPQNSF